MEAHAGHKNTTVTKRGGAGGLNLGLKGFKPVFFFRAFDGPKALCVCTTLRSHPIASLQTTEPTTPTRQTAKKEVAKHCVLTSLEGL